MSSLKDNAFLIFHSIIFYKWIQSANHLLIAYIFHTGQNVPSLSQVAKFSNIFLPEKAKWKWRIFVDVGIYYEEDLNKIYYSSTS